MPDFKNKIIKHCHSNALFQIINSIYYCMLCSAFIISNSTSHEIQIKTMKPNNFVQNTEIVSYPLWQSEEKNEINSFINKEEYLKQRPSIIKYINKTPTSNTKDATNNITTLLNILDKYVLNDSLVFLNILYIVYSIIDK